MEVALLRSTLAADRPKRKKKPSSQSSRREPADDCLRDLRHHWARLNGPNVFMALNSHPCVGKLLIYNVQGIFCLVVRS